VLARVNGKAVRLQPDLVRAPGEVVRLLDVMAQSNPRITSFVRFFDKDGTDRTKLDNALEYGFRVLRWRRT
jgi:hypothetical protein